MSALATREVSCSSSKLLNPIARFALALQPLEHPVALSATAREKRREVQDEEVDVIQAQLRQIVLGEPARSVTAVRGRRACPARRRATATSHHPLSTSPQQGSRAPCGDKQPHAWPRRG